ncbi:TPA: hemagglutinin repeat-containing protein [Campylobacter coli]|nr:hemagglutinin repeat-containing protein [Campylobacter coli]HEB7527776.1 hemagglutinin repeat-containing protein [Campylobacter coli]
MYLKPVEISYESANLETSKSISSTLNSKGDININTNGNIAITGSTLQADKSANLNGENKFQVLLILQQVLLLDISKVL